MIGAALDMKDLFRTTVRFQRLELSIDQLEELAHPRAPLLLGQQIGRLGDGATAHQKKAQ